MTLKKFRTFLVVAVFAVTLFVPQLLVTASAASKKSSNNAMRISPLRTDISVTPGNSKTVTIYIKNITNQKLTLQPIENDFVAGDEKGTPAIMLNQNQYAPTHSLKRFMVPLNSFQLNPGKTKPVELKIKVPRTAQAGGYFGALRFAPVANSDKPIVLSSSVASLVLLTVPGPTTHKLILSNFDVRQNGHNAGVFNSFRSPKSLSLFLRFENKGNIQESPFGQINVLKGKKSVYSYNFNDNKPKDVILPDSARRWQIPLKKIGSFGKYKVMGTFSYANGRSIQIDRSFWVIPIGYIIGAIAAIILVIVLIFGIRAFLKGYKKRILRSHHR